jgi:hypothetical protein
MNKISIILTIVFLLITFFTLIAKSKNTVVKNTTELQSTQGKSSLLLKRLETIKKMDKSNLNKAELACLLEEVRTINKHLIVIDSGLFISAGALIVILIVLIFLI